VVDALIKANKDFDLILIPNAHHGYAEASQYMMRRRWDYFVRYLAGNVPPLNYETKPFDETQRMVYANGGPSEDVEAGDSF
jgi:dipeptidyl-peptidase-4